MRADNIVYEGDNSYLGASAFVVTNTEKWAVSKVGLFNGRENASYVLNTQDQVTGTRTPKLYQTSRISAGSLRYYGLGLVNGPYNVSLLFAETNFPDPSTERWESRGRRVFDIYVQVNICPQPKIWSWRSCDSEITISLSLFLCIEK